MTAVTGLETSGSNVFSNHQYPYSSDELPNLSVYVAHEPETAHDDEEMGPLQLRVLPILIVGRVQTTAGLSDALDDICEEVETALNASTSVAALVKDLQLVSTVVEVDSEGEQPVGAARMEWEATYRVNKKAPVAPIQ